MSVDRHAHWENIYRTREPTKLSWFAPHLSDSLRLIREISSPESAVIDVGSGVSTLVDDLLASGYRNVTALDISEAALSEVRARLGAAGERVTWVQGDVTNVGLPGAAYDVWHDRAVFHFLTEETDRRAYVTALKQALKPHGHVIMGAFSLKGPDKCSGLNIVKYDASSLHRELGPDFVLTHTEDVIHVTPAGAEQAFVLCRFRR